MSLWIWYKLAGKPAQVKVEDIRILDVTNWSKLVVVQVICFTAIGGGGGAVAGGGSGYFLWLILYLFWIRFLCLVLKE